GVRLVADDVVVAYATDTGPHDALVELGRDADLYLIDATDRPGETDRVERTLLTATEAGAWAQRARARHLLLTHLWPGTDPVVSANHARQAFTGPVQVAAQDLVIDLAR